MTTATIRRQVAQPGVGTQVVRLLRSEWTKLRSVRSTVWTLIALVLVCVGLCVLFSWGVESRPQRGDGENPVTRIGAAAFTMRPLFLGQLVIGVLGVLAMSAEYSTGTIRATLSAAPQRIRVLAVKTAVFAVVAFVVSLATCFMSFFVGQAILSQQNLNTTLGAPNALRVVIGGALYLTAVGLLGLGLAAIFRHTAAAISTLVVLLLILTILVDFLPSDWAAASKYVPMNAGMAIIQQHQQVNTLEPWSGLAVLCGYAAVALIAGAVLLRRRDA